ncbi:diguanylate cyclase [Azoarcus communis]|uniref:sensor domain-containing diguanylate cyclase n=1 Tax=Parazoarcus communis TaxID=41977 RepID=UPI001459D1AF|nr:sensor domain-containing diguanylate cyclase [Parazoarcus communis]NMG47765.1 diguanylate cyclase [Parazoarcus communis]
MARSTLFAALRQTYFRSTLFAIVLGGVALAAVAFLALRAQVEDNLDRIARTVAYSVEAAVLFGDKQTADEILSQIAVREGLVEVAVRRVDGEIFAYARNASGEPLHRLGTQMDGAFVSHGVRAEVVSGQQVLGRVELRGDGKVFVVLFFRVLGVLLLSLGLAALVAKVLARRTEGRILAELDALAGMAHTLRLDGQFERRLPTFEIEEFDALGQDFNALLAEIQLRNAELVDRQLRLERANQSLQHLADHDSLTGMANRARFATLLKQALTEAAASGSHVGVLYLDNDRFKSINDRFGHSAGDALLIDVARRIRGAVRESDLVARLGGDEFAVLLAPLRDVGDAQRVADKILMAMTRGLRLADGVDIELGVSIGIAVYPDHASSDELLLQAADHAMYEAKRLGRGRACTYSPDVRMEP